LLALTLLSPLITIFIFKTGFDRLSIPRSNVFGSTYRASAEFRSNRRLGIDLAIADGPASSVLSWDLHAI